jgi:hypothetical protein
LTQFHGAAGVVMIAATSAALVGEGGRGGECSDGGGEDQETAHAYLNAALNLTRR